MQFKMTSKLPTKEGYYWWTNFGEHTPCILEVRRCGKDLWAEGGEYGFKVERPKLTKEDKDPDMMVDGHYFGEELWCPIPNPVINGREVEPSSY
jgi:hypothetical protein